MPNDTGQTWVAPQLEDRDIAALAGIEATRQLSLTIDRIGNVLTGLNDKVTAVHTDVQVMKEQNKAMEDLKDEVKQLKGEVLALKLRDAQQDGAAKFLAWMKDFGPWLIAILAFLWGLLGRHPS